MNKLLFSVPIVISSQVKYNYIIQKAKENYVFEILYCK